MRNSSFVNDVFHLSVIRAEINIIHIIIIREEYLIQYVSTKKLRFHVETIDSH